MKTKQFEPGDLVYDENSMTLGIVKRITWCIIGDVYMIDTGLSHYIGYLVSLNTLTLIEKGAFK